MTAAAADLTQVRETKGPLLSAQGVIKNAAQLYLAAFGAIDAATGYLKPWASASGELLMGPIEQGENYGTGLGNTSATFKPTAKIQAAGGLRFSVAVTGASAATDAGKYVYLADDQTFTLTRPSLGLPCGVIREWLTGTTCHVEFFSAALLRVIELAGAGQYEVPLGVFAFDDLTTAKKFFRWKAPHHGKIVGLSANVGTDFAGGTSITFQAKIGATNVTNGTLAFATDAAETVITEGGALAANEFHEGDVITLTPTIVGVYAGGVAHVSMRVQTLPGL